MRGAQRGPYEPPHGPAQLRGSSGAGQGGDGLAPPAGLPGRVRVLLRLPPRRPEGADPGLSLRAAHAPGGGHPPPGGGPHGGDHRPLPRRLRQGAPRRLDPGEPRRYGHGPVEALSGEDHPPGPQAAGPAPALDRLHPEDGGQLPAGQVRAGPAGGVSHRLSALVPAAGAAGGRDRLPAAGDRHGPAGGGAGGPPALRSAPVRPEPGGAGGRDGARGGGAAAGLAAPGHRHPGRRAPLPAGHGLRRQRLSGPAAGHDGGGAHRGVPPAPGRGRRGPDLPGQPEDRHPLDHQGDQHPSAHRLRPDRGRPPAAHRHPPDQPGEGQRPGHRPPRRRRRPAGHRPPAGGGGAQRGGRGAGAGPGDRAAGVFQVYPRLPGPVLPLSAPHPAGGDALGP